jgi:iron(III) transport system substrate-binding protein
MSFKRKLVGICLGLSIFWIPSGCIFKKTVWIYTNLSKEVTDEMSASLSVKVPDADVKWYQGSTESVTHKIKLEYESGKVQADLVLISDPLWYVAQKQEGHLLPYKSEAAQGVAPEYRDPDDTFVAARVSVMLMGYNPDFLKVEELPARWSDLTHSQWQGRVSMGNPLEYATQFIALGSLVKLQGWDFFSKLKKLKLFAEGSNSAVLKRIQSGERPVGILLLETLLRAKAGGSSVRILYPADGLIPIPGPIAILKSTKNPTHSKRVYDWFFSSQAQTALVREGMYSPVHGAIRPEGARSWDEIQSKMMKLSPTLLPDMLKDRDLIRAKFSDVVFHE